MRERERDGGKEGRGRRRERREEGRPLVYARKNFLEVMRCGKTYSRSFDLNFIIPKDQNLEILLYLESPVVFFFDSDKTTDKPE